MIVDDVCVEDGEVMCSLLKNWADVYPFIAEKKGSSMMVRPKRIIVTSNYKIREIFYRAGDYEPLEARFNEIFMQGRDNNNKPIFKY